MPPTPRQPSTTAFVKTTRPEIAGIVAREALFARLDGTSSRTVAWIAGPAGSGKSTLAASYVAARNYRAAWYQVDRDDDDIESFFHFLAHAAERIGVAPESLPALDATARGDLPAYARAFFRRLFAEAGAGAALVIDNLDWSDERSPLRRCLEHGLTQVPRHCAVLVTSRDEPPPGLARLRANGDMVCLGADELRLSLAELQALAERRGRPLDAAEAGRMQAQAQGWAAAIVLMLEHAKMTGEFAAPADGSTPAVLFDYLASEIFARFEPASRQVLLSIACLPRLTAEIATSLSGDARAARLLLNLSHNDYFVREVLAGTQRVYAMHPLYREFLLRTAARERPEAVAPEALVRGAHLLVQAGLHDDAVGLFAQAGDWPAMAAAVAEQADALLAQGRRATLLGWLERMPPAMLEADAALLCADAACRLAESPRAARQRFEQAWRLARERADQATQRRACAGIVEAIVSEFDDLAALDPWLTELAALADGAASTIRTTLMSALFLRDPGAAGFVAWCAAPKLGESDACALVLRRLASLLRGDAAAADAIGAALSALAPSGAHADAAALVEVVRSWLDGDAEAAWRGLEALEAQTRALAGPLLWRAMLRAAVALARDDSAAAAQALEALEGRLLRRGERALLHLLHAALAAARHEPALALREARGALHVAIEVGAPWIEALARLALAQAEIHGGDRVAAQAQLAGADALAQRIGSSMLQASLRLVHAAIDMAQDDDAVASHSLRQAMSSLRTLGVRQVLGLAPGALAAVLAQALREGIEVDVAQGLVRRLGLRPPAQARRLRRWAWRYELCTLGGFELLREGQPIESSAKGPGRPLELLKVLVAYRRAPCARRRTHRCAVAACRRRLRLQVVHRHAAPAAAPARRRRSRAAARRPAEPESDPLLDRRLGLRSPGGRGRRLRGCGRARSANARAGGRTRRPLPRPVPARRERPERLPGAARATARASAARARSGLAGRGRRTGCGPGRRLGALHPGRRTARALPPRTDAGPAPARRHLTGCRRLPAPVCPARRAAALASLAGDTGGLSGPPGSLMPGSSRLPVV